MVLCSSQQSMLVELIKSCHPDQLRIPALLWTRSAVCELIEHECGVRLDLSTVGRYLRRWGFTLKRPVSARSRLTRSSSRRGLRRSTRRSVSARA